MARGLSAGIVLVGLAVACAEPAPPTLDVESVVAGLGGAIWPDEPAAVTDIACPALDPAVIEQSSVCTARLRDDVLTVDVTVDATGATAATVREPLFPLADVEEQLAERLAADLGGAVEGLTVTCETSVVVARPGAVVRCTADRVGDRVEFDVTVIDRDGAWRLDYVP